MEKGKIFWIAFALLFTLTSLVSIAQATNVALVVKNATNLNEEHEKPINKTLSLSGYNVTLIDSMVNFSGFDVIVVAGRQCFSSDNLGSFVADIPVNDYPTIAIDCKYILNWGWATSASSIFSSQRQRVYIFNEAHPISQGYSGMLTIHTIAGKPLIAIDKYKTNLKPIATSSDSGDYRVIAYAEPKTTLSNGNTTKARIVFFGVTYPLYWTDDAETLFLRAVEWAINDYDKDKVRDDIDLCPSTPIGEVVDENGCSCSQKTCNDGVGCTIDTCNTNTAHCIHTLNHSFCGDSKWYDADERWVSSAECKEKKEIKQEYRNYYCTLSGCAYDVIETRWIDTSNTRNKPDGTACDDGLYCTVNDACTSGTCGGVARDCSSFNLPKIETCDNNPDNNPFTWDYFPGFTSVCDESLDKCTIGTLNITHTCSKQRCNATCEVDSDCKARCEADILYYGTCSNCTCSYLTKNCSEDSKWHNTNETRWTDSEDIHLEKKQIKREYRQYFCAQDDCQYNVTNTTWIDANETRYRTSGAVFVSGNNTSIMVNASSNINTIFSGMQRVEFLDPQNKSILEFDFNFSSGNLNASNIEIIRNEVSGVGSIVVRGLDNHSKTIWVDKMLNANHVCIKDYEITSIAELSPACNGTGEILIKCDGSSVDSYSCTFDSSINKYKITGLMHSGAKEQETCDDGIQNQGEEGIDCGGPCSACPSVTTTSGLFSYSGSSLFIERRVNCSLPTIININEGETQTFKVSVKNTGNVKLLKVHLNLSGIPSGWFIAAGEENLEVGETKTFNVTLNPSSPGNYNITLKVYAGNTFLYKNNISLTVIQKKIEKPEIEIVSFSLSDLEDYRISAVVELNNTGNARADGILSLLVPEGWSVEPEENLISIDPNQKMSYEFIITYPEDANGIFSIIARSIVNGEITESVTEIEKAYLEEQAPTGMVTSSPSFDSFIMPMLIISILIASAIGAYYINNNLRYKRAIEMAYKKYDAWKRNNHRGNRRYKRYNFRAR